MKLKNHEKINYIVVYMHNVKHMIKVLEIYTIIDRYDQKNIFLFFFCFDQFE